MKITPLFLVILCLSPLPRICQADAIEASANQGGTVQLEPFHVKEFFSGSYSSDPRTRMMISYKVTWVGPASAKIGLRDGDLLTSIDDVPLKTMSLDQFLAASDLNMDSASKHAFVFTGKRGFFRRPQTITLIITVEPKKKPESSQATLP